MNSAWPLRKEGSYLGRERIHLWRLAPLEDSLHGHEFFELAYVMSGSSQHQLGAQTIRVQEGDYFIIDVGSPHCYRENDGFVIVNCLFAPEYVDRALVNCPSLSALLSAQVRQFGVPAMGGKAADRLYHDSDGSIRRLISAFPKSHLSDRYHAEEKAANMLNYILFELMDTTAFPSTNEHISRIIHLVEDRLTEKLTLQDISREIGLTKEYISHIFKKEMNKTLTDYINERKMLLAKELIYAESMRLTDLSAYLGYENYSYFSTLFKRYFQVTPIQFKKES